MNILQITFQWFVIHSVNKFAHWHEDGKQIATQLSLPFPCLLHPYIFIECNLLYSPTGLPEWANIPWEPWNEHWRNNVTSMTLSDNFIHVSKRRWCSINLIFTPRSWSLLYRLLLSTLKCWIIMTTSNRRFCFFLLSNKHLTVSK